MPRKKRLDSLFQREIGNVIAKTLDTSREYLITVTRVDAAPDTSFAKVFISVLPETFQQAARASLRAIVPDIKRALGKLDFKRTPDLAFYIDPQGERLNEVDDILRQINERS